MCARPRIVAGHDGGRYTTARAVGARARRSVTDCGFAVVAVEARPRQPCFAVAAATAAQRIGVGQADGVGVLDQVRDGVQTQRGVVGSKAAGRCGWGQLP